MSLNIDTSILRGDLKFNESMARYTSWKAGGNAEYFYRAVDTDDLSNFLSMLPTNIPITWIGLGSNLLVRDGGVRGIVISVTSVLDELEKISDTKLKVGAGLSCAKAARFAAKHGLAGVEFLAGIPGTIGGALAMNAGAYGGEIWNVVEETETINREGKRQTRNRSEFDIAYRSVSITEEEWFLSATLQLQISDKAIVEQSIKSMLAERADAQPLGQYSCGSVFRNPTNDYAARLIDDCGLKNTTLGGAHISDKHANFIINSNNASAADIENLIKLIQQKVFEKHNINLIPEVRIIGEYEQSEVVTEQ